MVRLICVPGYIELIETLFIAEQNLFSMSIRSSFDENVLTYATDQLTAACRASLRITAPMVQMSEECIAIVAPGRFRLSFVKVPGSTNLDAFEYLAVRMEL